MGRTLAWTSAPLPAEREGLAASAPSPPLSLFAASDFTAEGPCHARRRASDSARAVRGWAAGSEPRCNEWGGNSNIQRGTNTRGA